VRRGVCLVACASRLAQLSDKDGRIVEMAKDHFNSSDHFELIGAYISPVNDHYSKAELIQATHRVTMSILASHTSDWIMVDDWESRQTSWQRTCTVLQHFRTEIDVLFPTRTVRIMLLTGSDLIETFALPGVWSEEDVSDTGDVDSSPGDND
jgi:nicotinamide mononucleotide adenylyltransferase